MGDDSPKNKVKFLCSQGGKVLPRPSDGLLKYVGGETRVVSVPRDITFIELMKKLSSMFEGEMVLKYQLVPEDLDALVSVRTQEDLKHMIEEHDRHHPGLLRAFLFPQKPLVVDLVPPSESPPPNYMLSDQRYIDAINGVVVRTSPRARGSASSTPKSTSPDAVAASAPHSPFHSSLSYRLAPNANSTSTSNAMHRVRSSPSLTNLNEHYHHQPYLSSRPPQDPSQGGRMMNMTSSSSNVNSNSNSSSRGGGYNYSYYNCSPTRSHNHKPYAYQDDSAAYAPPPPLMLERLHSIQRSPRRSIWD